MSPDWALPDQLVYSVVSSLLQLASHYPRFSKPITDAVVEFSATVVEKIQSFILLSRIRIFPRDDLHLRKTEALDRKEKVRKEGSRGSQVVENG